MCYNSKDNHGKYGNSRIFHLIDMQVGKIQLVKHKSQINRNLVCNTQALNNKIRATVDLCDPASIREAGNFSVLIFVFL